MARIQTQERAMPTIPLTTHARVRMQQRGIAPDALAMLLEIGRVGYAPGGCQIVFIEKHERRRLCDLEKTRVRGRDRLSGLYAITDEHGTVITVGHRYRRLARSAR
jgi:hypothetical protein